MISHYNAWNSFDFRCINIHQITLERFFILFYLMALCIGTTHNIYIKTVKEKKRKKKKKKTMTQII